MNAFTPIPDVTITLTESQANVTRKALEHYAAHCAKIRMIEMGKLAFEIHDSLLVTQLMA